MKKRTIKESNLIVIEPSTIRFDERKFFVVRFTDESEFVEAATEYTSTRRSPVFKIDAKDDVLDGYSEKVRAIYNQVCDESVLLKFFEIKNGDDELDKRLARESAQEAEALGDA